MTNTVPRFVSTLRTWFAAVTQVNKNFDGTGSFVDLVTGTQEGSRIDYIMVQGQASTPVNAINLYLATANNTTYYWDRITVAATTPDPGLTEEGFTATLTPTEPVFLPSGYKLRVALYTAGTFNVFAQGGDY